MADYNKYGKKMDARVHPSVTCGSFSSLEGPHKYITMDIWANKLTMSFVDATNRDNLISLKFSMVLDRLEYFQTLLKSIYEKRVNAYIAMQEYERIEVPYRFNCIKTGTKAIPGQEPHILLYTRDVEGVPRITFKGVDNGREIEIILGSLYVESACIDPDNESKARFLDKVDVPIARMIKMMKDMQPNLFLYKLFTAFFDLYIGPVRRDNQGNQYNGNNRNFSSKSNYGGNQGFENANGKIELNATEGDDDITI